MLPHNNTGGHSCTLFLLQTDPGPLVRETQSYVALKEKEIGDPWSKELDNLTIYKQWVWLKVTVIPLSNSCCLNR